MMRMQNGYLVRHTGRGRDHPDISDLSISSYVTNGFASIDHDNLSSLKRIFGMDGANGGEMFDTIEGCLEPRWPTGAKHDRRPIVARGPRTDTETNCQRRVHR
jgi:hypothetical protein